MSKPEAERYITDEMLDHFIKSMFGTLTNVNFDRTEHVNMLTKITEHRDFLREKLAKDPALERSDSPASFEFKNDTTYLLEEGDKVGIIKRKAELGNDDLFGLLEMAIYGMKGISAYLYHAEVLRAEKKEAYTDAERRGIFKEIVRIMADLTNTKPTMESLLALNMDLGKANVTVMSYLDRGHTINFGTPSPAEVPRSPVEGKCILISGHDMVCLKGLLE